MQKKKYQLYQTHDPFHAREAEKYDNPLPSREYIMQCMNELCKPLPCEKLVSIFGLVDADRQVLFRKRLDAMEKQGQLMRNRRDKYILVKQLALIQGRVVAHKEGFGFLIPNDGTEDLFISPYHMRSLLPNDRILARAVVNHRGKKDAVPVEILERVVQHIVGRYRKKKSIAFVLPHHKDFSQDMIIPSDAENGAVDGQYVLAEIVTHPTVRRQATGKIVRVLGDYLSPGMEIEVVVHSYDIPTEWPDEVVKEIKPLSLEIATADKIESGRKDIRNLPLVTIDGKDAKDFDDAVYCETQSDESFRLVVAIADVSHYVLPDTALDIEACKRGNSVYFPGRVIPMLPEILSNELCSLKPYVDRLCLVCDMHISAEGTLMQAQFYDAVMRSRARLTYPDVTAMLNHEKKTRSALLPYLENLKQVYERMFIQREKRGALDFDSKETAIIFGKNKKIKSIIPVERTIAHRIIEECMLMANYAAAQFLIRHEIPMLYRVHTGPNPNKAENLNSFLKSFGLALKEKPTSQDYQNLLEQVEKLPHTHLISTVLLRSLMQAIYSPNNTGHFGLAYESYTHFTSPIRRYPDLLVHRAIRYQLQHEKKKQPVFLYDVARMQQLGEHCSATERRADQATRDAINWLKCYYMQDKLGKTFYGMITGVTAFGVFVELNDIYVEGLLHISALSDDYYHYNPIYHLLRGEHTGKTYRLGDPIHVRVVRANPDERKLELELLQNEQE